MMRITPALIIAGVVLAFTSPTVSAAPPSRSAGSLHHADPAPTPPRDHNPLKLLLPDGTDAASCADPMVIHGKQRGDRNWYLYCTSDALTAAPGADGKPVIHNLPMFRSTNLTTWHYAGDAFATKPGWVAPSAGMWAPDVAYRHGRYYLYYAASATNTPGGGSAVGVATSLHPTGPWVDAGAPVVAPQQVANGSGWRWQFDPEVITAGSHTYLYFGSYFGGVHARELSADGLHSLPGTETAIAIDNRYEGTTIVKHAGWYYFMGSATNCCNGPLTGYAVFAARSRSPLGPFRDRDGRSILSGRVGGTPVITQNGNRWVGTGHNTVITDFAGQDWTIYHAVDRHHPYYAGDVGYTKRPALIDPIDWRDGWPVVRGGRGPSETSMPGPVAQPGQRPGYHRSFISTLQPGRSIDRLSDNFNGTTLSSRWSWIRPPAADNSPSVKGGVLR